MTRNERLPAQLPILDDDELYAARAALAVYAAAPRGSSPRAVDRVMAKLIVAYPSARLSDAEAGLRLELYAEQLGDISADVLMAGAMAAVRSLKFFPTVSELRELAMSQPAVPRVRRQWRLQQLVAATEEAQAAEDVEYVTPAEVAEILAAAKLKPSSVVMIRPDTIAA